MATAKRGRPKALNDEGQEKLRALAAENPYLTLLQLRELLLERHQIKVCVETVRTALAALGLSRPPPSQRPKPIPVLEFAASPPARRRYAYRDVHRFDPKAPGYPSDVTDSEWALLEDLFDPPGPGRPPQFDRRIILNACLYVLRTGCAWRMLPKNFPSWDTVYAVFKRWSVKGLFEQVYERLRIAHRQDLGKSGCPTAAIIDSQSVKTGPQGGEKGYDAGKKVKGRKRHIVTDFLGLMLAVLILPANIQDRDAAVATVQAAKDKQPSIQAVIADTAYAGQCALELEQKAEVKVEIIKRPNRQAISQDGQPVAAPKTGFILLPKRWIIERTNGWLLRFRRLVVDHERKVQHATSWVWLAGSAILWRRIASG